MTTTPRVLPVGVVAVSAVVAAFGFRGVFPDWTFVPAAVIGALGASIVGVVGRRLRLTVGESLLASLTAFAALGAVAAAGVPTPSAYRTFADGLVNGWAQVLSSMPPATLVGEYRVLPYTVAWLAAMVGGEILRVDHPDRAPRVRRLGGLAILGPLASFGLTSLITVERRPVAVAQGAALAAGALVLGYLHQARAAGDAATPADHDPALGERRPGWRETAWARAAAAVAMVVVVTVAAVVVGPRVPNADAHARFDLRRFQTPPFDPLDEPTPLGQVKAGLQDENADRVVFTVTSPEPVTRVTLATLGHYDGEHWNVAAPTVSEAGGRDRAEFRPVDEVFPAPVDGTISGWSRVPATIRIEHLSDLAAGEFDPVWLPVPGWPISVRPTGGSAERRLELHFDAASGNVAVAPDGPPAGLEYDVVAAVPPDPAELPLAAAPVDLTDPYDLAMPQLRSFAATVLEGADVGYEQIAAIRMWLVDRGAYDSRADSDTARPGHNLLRLGEMLADPDRIVGFEEQYAAAAALLARSQGLPARVAVGFVVPADEVAGRVAPDADGDTVTFLAGDINAWVEVRFDEYGWLPFDVTPPRERLPEDTPIGRTEREVALPDPPPEPPPPAVPPDLDADTELDEDEIDEDEDAPAAGRSPNWRRVAVAAAAGSPLVALLAGVVTVVVLKRRRTARRRSGPPARRVAGAWYELVDRLAEQGASPPPAATPREAALGLRDAEVVTDDEAARLIALADDVDRAAFAATPPTPEVAERAWAHATEVAEALWSRRTPVRRLLQRVDPRPLRHRDPLAHTGPAEAPLEPSTAAAADEDVHV